jgi:hypothetical protein
MNQIEVIKAILAGEVLDVKWRDSDWGAFNNANLNVEFVLHAFISQYDRYSLAEFRIRPKAVRFQTRAYLVGTTIYVWTSSWAQTQEETASMYSKTDGGFRWLEETQETEYTI